MRVSIVVALFILTIASIACGHDQTIHLEPEDGPFFAMPTIYNKSAVESLVWQLPGADDTRIVITPSFGSEWGYLIELRYRDTHRSPRKTQQ